MNQQEEIKMTYSGLFQRDGKKCARVFFERGKDACAEAVIPNAVIEKSTGFSQEELEQLLAYLQENTSRLLEKASGINFLKSWMKEK